MTAPLTPSEHTVLAAIEKAAARGERCPSNDQIAGIIGCGLGSASGMVTALERKGWIAVERGSTNRVVTVLATGKCTAGTVTSPHFRLREQVDGEARLAGTRRAIARSTGTVRTPVPSKMAEIEPNYTQRDPCFFCGVRGDAEIKCARCGP